MRVQHPREEAADDDADEAEDRGQHREFGLGTIGRLVPEPDGIAGRGRLFPGSHVTHRQQDRAGR